MITEQTNRQKTWTSFILIYCLCLLLVLIGIILWENRFYKNGVPVEEYEQLPPASSVYLININLAPSEELQDLPKIGPVLAAEIIAYREANGKFSKKEDLLQVKGIGKGIFEAIKGLITV